MKFNKCLKLFSILFECSFLGSVVLYIYNYYISTRKYDTMPITIKSTLDLFIIVAVFSLILLLIIKYVLHLRNKTNNENIQLEMNFEEEKNRNIEEKYRNLESPITERVFVYKEDFEVPRERQINCPNCGRVIDKNATICIKCGYLLKPVIQERIVEKIVEVPKEEKSFNDFYETRNKKSNKSYKNIYINGILIIGIIVCVILIVNMAIERGIIG